MPTNEENVKFLHGVLTNKGVPKVNWDPICEALDLKKGAVQKRWSRLQHAAAKGDKLPGSAEQLLWLMVKHQTSDTDKSFDWQAIAEACNSTPGAVSKRFSRLKLAMENGAAPPSAPATANSSPEAVKKTPTKGNGKAKDDEDIMATPTKRKRIVKEVDPKDNEDDSKGNEDDGEEIGLTPKRSKATPKSKPRPKMGFRASDEKNAVNVKEEPEDEMIISSLGNQLGSRDRFIRTMSSLPKTMKAVVIEKTGGTDVLQYKTDVPVPEPKGDEVLIKNEYIGINYIDTYFRSGVYNPPSFPYILGREGAGTIAALGPSAHSDLTVGARVAYMGQNAYAEYTPASSTYVTTLPDSIDAKIGAAAPLQALTALTLIREAYAVQKGDWVLVTAAAGGVGLWLCQLLKAVGARTIATASTEEKRELAKQNGAEIVLGYYAEDRDQFVKKVLEITGGEGVHAVFDSVGKDTFDSSLAVVRRKGTMVSFGNASGPVTGFSLARLSAKNVKLLRTTLFNYIATREEFQQYSKELWGFIEKDGLNVKIHDIYPLEDIKRATEDIEGRKTTGKLLLKP
ncbi:NADPH:quinone reductase [Curvularia kusanoi]|uniref:Probable quinone oxidoreductase n=1 Tax=Curvularia kusanoi TaxID=90978 RepID=A0A9P4TGV8_CURKU|nr:NADPH:quinone reductase [Curvularia kusanoi]